MPVLASSVLSEQLSLRGSGQTFQHHWSVCSSSSDLNRGGSCGICLKSHLHFQWREARSAEGSGRLPPAPGVVQQTPCQGGADLCLDPYCSVVLSVTWCSLDKARVTSSILCYHSLSALLLLHLCLHCNLILSQTTLSQSSASLKRLPAVIP